MRVNIHHLTAGFLLVNNWSSVQPYIAILSLALTLVLLVVFMAFVTVFRHRLGRLAAEFKGRDTATGKLAAELEAQALLARQMSADLEELRKRLLEREANAQTSTSAWETSSVPLNLNRRGQILRLSRKGKSVAEIANDLNIAQGEVELLLKVHDLSEKPSDAKI